MRDFKELKDINTGEKCFVIGAGPSLKNVKLSRINDVIITMNSSILALSWKKIDPQKHFWIGLDLGVLDWSYFSQNVMLSKCTKVVSSKYRKHLRDRCANFFYFRSRRSKVNQPFIKDDPGLCFLSCSTAAIDFAIWMGCKKIFLLGMDHTCSSQTYFWEYRPKKDRPYYKSSSRKFRPNHQAQLGVFKQNMVLYQWLKQYAHEQGAYIANCTERSSISNFPFMTYEDALNA